MSDDVQCDRNAGKNDKESEPRRRSKVPRKICAFVATTTLSSSVDDTATLARLSSNNGTHNLTWPEKKVKRKRKRKRPEPDLQQSGSIYVQGFPNDWTKEKVLEECSTLDIYPTNVKMKAPGKCMLFFS